MQAEIGTHPSDGRVLLHVETQEEWRTWLERNHEDSKGVWLVSWKKVTGRPFVPYPDAVDEALCFGWVDSRTQPAGRRAGDEALHAPRNPRSSWSRINKKKVARLTEQGRMAAAGVSLVETAKRNGTWTVYDEIEDLLIPPDLASALAKNKTAQAFFDNFSDSSKKSILWWIKMARKPNTRTARIVKTVQLAAENRMANHPKGRDKGPKPRSG